jgi:hypothetical protein
VIFNEAPYSREEAILAAFSPLHMDRLEPALKQVADPFVKRSNDWNRLSERF